MNRLLSARLPGRPLGLALGGALARDALTGAAVAAGSVVVFVLLFRLWEADLHAPFAYVWDANFNAMVVKGVLENGWYLVNPHLGAPFGQELYDFPQSGENLQILIVKALGVVSSSPAVVMNLFFALSFPLVALAAYLVLRALGLTRAVAAAMALLFTFLPVHLRGEDHLFLVAYYGVPLGAYLVLSVATGRPLFRGWRAWGTWATVAGCVVVGASSLYYAAFTVLLVAAAALLAFAVRRTREALVAGALVVAIVGATLAVGAIPSFVYWAQHGRNAAVVRAPRDSELYGLRLSTLVLPEDHHRLGPVAGFKQEYTGTAPLPGEPGETLGIVAAAGFLVLLVVVLLRALGRPVGGPLVGWTAVLALVGFLIATVGGVSALIAYVFTPEIRVWARMSLFLAFFAFVAVGLALEWLRARRGVVWLAPALVAIVALGLADQTSGYWVPAYSQVARQYADDASFVTRIEQTLPPGAAVFQLPYTPFPEATVGKMANYDPARLYLHSNRLRWSYGAMKGRPEDWAAQLAGRRLEVVVPAVAVSGFSGIVVDRKGYVGGGDRVVRRIERLTDVQPVSSPDGRLVFFDLRRYVSLLSSPPADVRRATLYPVRIDSGPGLGPSERDGQHRWRWGGKEATFELVNPRTRPVRARFRARLETGYDNPIQFAIAWPRRRETVTVTRSRIARRQLVLPPGSTKVRLKLSGPQLHPVHADTTRRYFRLVDELLIER